MHLSSFYWIQRTTIYVVPSSGGFAATFSREREKGYLALSGDASL